MQERELAQVLATELGRAIGIDGLAFDDAGELSLLIDDARLLHVLFDEARRGLVLFTRVAEADQLSPDLLKRAMQAHFGWGFTAGGQFALEPEGGGMVFQQLLPIDGLDSGALQQALEHFVQIADHWSTLASSSEAADDDDPPTVGESALPSDITQRLTFRA